MKAKFYSICIPCNKTLAELVTILTLKVLFTSENCSLGH